MGSAAEATSSLGETLEQMLPTLFYGIIVAPIELSTGIKV